MRHPNFVVLAAMAAIAVLTTAAIPALAQSPPRNMSAEMAMPSAVDLNDPMSQEASGTAWVPSSTPVYARMFMRPSGDMLMGEGSPESTKG